VGNFLSDMIAFIEGLAWKTDDYWIEDCSSEMETDQHKCVNFRAFFTALSKSEIAIKTLSGCFINPRAANEEYCCIWGEERWR
jgi:hypothetical protein